MNFSGFYWVLVGFSEFKWGFKRGLVGISGFYRFLLSLTGL